MRVRRKYFAVGAVAVGVAVGGVVPVEADAAKKKTINVLLEDLNSPKGLALNSFGDLVIAQGAFGPPDPVLVHVLAGRIAGTRSRSPTR